MMDLRGKVALVTGGAVRIGAALSDALADAGASVVVHHHASAVAADELCDRLRKRGAQAWTLRADLADPEATARVVDEARALAGRVDVLVNNASTYPHETLPETSDALLHETLQINAWAPLALTRAFAAQVETEGAVVNILDTHLHRLARGKFAYQLAKQALAWTTRATALEYAPRVRVNGVAPGAILPPPGEGEDYLRRLGDRLPLRRHGAPSDVAETALFLARSRFVTGVVVEVDGGEHLGGRA